jgi:hypothetical protein
MSYARDVAKLGIEVGQVVARHEQTSAVVDFSRYRDAPVAFMRDVLNFEPWSKQIEIAESVLSHKRTVCSGCHAAGKDAVLAPLMLWAAYARGMLVLAISATEKQLLGQLWREVRARFGDELPGVLWTSALELAGEKRIIAMTSGSISNLTGWHDAHGVFVAISEGQGEQVEAAAFDAAAANTTDDASRIVIVGNPLRAVGRFYEVHQKPTWSKISISAFDHPNIVEQRVVIPGGPSPSWPSEMAAEYGTDSGFYSARVLGQFPSEGSVDSLILRAWLEGAFERHETAGPALSRWPLPMIGLDVARSTARDESVAAIVQGSRVHELHAWRSRDLVETSNRFLRVAADARLQWYADGRAIEKENRVVQDPVALDTWLDSQGVPQFKLIVDSPGVGGGVVDVIRARGRAVEEYWGWNPAADERRFANTRAEVYWALRSGLEAGTVALPRDANLEEELLAMEWSEDGRGRIIMVAKEDLRKTLGRSPDRLDAATIALAASMGGIHRSSVGFFHARM